MKEQFINTGTFFANYGDIIKLNIPPMIESALRVLDQHKNDWKQYNPRKDNNPRFGLSITSLDGGLSGVPDLDSLREYNLLNTTDYREIDFNKPTSVALSIPELKSLLEKLSPVGRCHFLKLQQGGFFPPHRDGGIVWPPVTARLFCTIKNAGSKNFCWLQEGKQITFEEGTWYLINTTKEHSVFSFSDDCIVAVLNIPLSLHNLEFFLRTVAVT